MRGAALGVAVGAGRETGRRLVLLVDRVGTTQWRRRRLIWVAACLIVLVLPEAAILVAGVPLPPVDGLLFGYWLIIAAFGLSELLVPRKFLSWRRAMLDGSPASVRTVDEAFDRALRSAAETNGAAIRNVRLIGAALVVAGTLTTFGLWLLLHVSGIA